MSFTTAKGLLCLDAGVFVAFPPDEYVLDYVFFQGEFGLFARDEIGGEPLVYGDYGAGAR